MAGNEQDGFSTRDVFLRGSVLAVIVAVPSLAVFVGLWYVLDDLITAAVVGAIVHFVAMGFSLKISKKFLVKKGE